MSQRPVIDLVAAARRCRSRSRSAPLYLPFTISVQTPRPVYPELRDDGDVTYCVVVGAGGDCADGAGNDADGAAVLSSERRRQLVAARPFYSAMA